MGQLLNISIDLSKVDKSRIIKGKNGSKYYNLSLWVADEKDQYGNDVSVFDSQTKEQRDAKEKRNFLGNGRVMFGSQQQPAQQSNYSQYNGSTEDSSNLPF